MRGRTRRGVQRGEVHRGGARAAEAARPFPPPVLTSTATRVDSYHVIPAPAPRNHPQSSPNDISKTVQVS
jgi:hypothetical protein